MGQDQTHLGIIPYKPVSPLWSDNAYKERFIALPGVDQMEYREIGGWDFPENGLLIKNFLLPLDERDTTGSLKRIETRLLLWKNNIWNGFSYEWNEAETDATLLNTSKMRAFTITLEDGSTLEYEWLYPARYDCIRCHSFAANGALGPSTSQLNSDFLFPASGVTDNQMRTYEHIDLFRENLPAPLDSLPRMVDPMDDTQSLHDRARSYMSSNCAMCHQPGGPTPAEIDLRWEASDEEMNAIGVEPNLGNLGIADALLIAPGDPDRSILYVRMNQRNTGRHMPPLATSRIDEDAVSLVREWILSMPGPEPLVSWIFY
jgi:uncharacterized repeat protein (TIGR03806 family)